VASPHVCDEVLHLALLMAGETTVPEEPEAARAFATGPLRHAITHFLGAETAHNIDTELEPVLTMASSQLRVSSAIIGSLYETMDLGDEEQDEPSATRSVRRDVADAVVIAATTERSLAAALERWLGPRVQIETCDHVFAFISALEANANARGLVLIDTRKPAVDAATIAAMLPLLPEATRVVIWGRSEEAARIIGEVGERARSWVRCSADTSEDDVAALCMALLA